MKVLVIFFLVTLTCHSQTGTIKFMVEQENGYYEILVNDTLLIKTFKDTFPVGKYKAEIWSEGYCKIDTSFIIKENIETVCYQKLTRSDNYYSQIKEGVLRNKKKSVYCRLPFFLTIAGASIAVPFGIGTARKLEEANLFVEEYNKIGGLFNVQMFKSELLQIQDSYNRSRSIFYTSLTLSSLCAVTSIFGYYFLNKRYPKKTMIFKPSPFSDRIGFNCTINSFSLTLSI